MFMSRKGAAEVLRNIVTNYLREIVRIAVFLLITPYIAARIGIESFGLWSLIWATIGLLGLLDLGFATSVVKYVADARGKRDIDRLRRLTATLFWVYLALGLLLFSSSAFLAVHIGTLYRLPEYLATPARNAFTIIALRAALAMPMGMFMGVMIGHQKQSWSNLIRSVELVAYGLSVWIGLSYTTSIEVLAWLNLGTNVAANAATMMVCRVRLDGFSVSPWEFRAKYVRQVSSFSLYFFIIQISLLLYGRVDALVIQRVLSLSAVVYYTVALRIAEHAASFCRQLTNALTPTLAELEGAGNRAGVRAVYEVGGRLSVAFSFPLMFSLLWFTRSLLSLWMGADFAAASGVARVLVLAAVVSVVHANAANVLSMTGSQRFLALSLFGGQVMNLTLTLLLIRPLGIGGAALATLVSTVLVDVGLVQRRAGRLHDDSLLGFYRRSVWPAILPTVIMLLTLAALTALWEPRALWVVAVEAASGWAVFAISFFFLGLSSAERCLVMKKLVEIRSAPFNETVSPA